MCEWQLRRRIHYFCCQHLFGATIYLRCCLPIVEASAGDLKTELRAVGITTLNFTRLEGISNGLLPKLEI